MTNLLVACALLAVPNEAVRTIPADWGLPGWYVKGIRVDGIAIGGSQKVSDRAILEAGRLTAILLKPIPKVARELVRQNIHVAVMASEEVTTDVPEHAILPKRYPETNWDERARGLGPVANIRVVSCAEENLLRFWQDRYRGESIFIHEFSHAIMDFGLKRLDKGFEPRLQSAFDNAKSRGKWKDTYALANLQEYWAEGVQSFFAANYEVKAADGVHNGINTPEELKAYDPPLYALLEATFSEPQFRWSE